MQSPRDACGPEIGVPVFGKQSLSPPACQFALIAERAQFDGLEADWNALFDRAGRPHQVFQQFSWLWHWANHYADRDAGFSIVTGRRNGRLVLIWPLVMTRIAGLKKLSWMGEPVSQYGDALADSEEDATDLLHTSWAYILSLGADIISLRKIRSDAAVSRLLAETGAVRGACSNAPSLDLGSAKDFETYCRRYSAKRRSDLRRHLRCLNEAGSITFEQHQCGEVAGELAGHAIALKRAWLTERGIIFPPLQDSRFERFFGAIALDRTRSPGIRISAVRCNGEPIGVEISLQCKDHVFGAIISHNLEFAKQGAGVVLAEYSIRTAHECGYVRFDLLPPADPYKMNWADGAIMVADWAAPLTRAGALYARAWLGFGRQLVKKAAVALPPWLGRTVAATYYRAT
jgi:CelD/BcsL family acetyltransferase involved in cellulose biosynthesis